MKTLIFRFVILTFSILQSSCVTKPVAVDVGSGHRWESKAIITNRLNKKEQNLSMTLVGIKGDQLRVEATVTLGYQVGTLVANRKAFTGIIYPQKVAYSGRSSTEAVYRLVQIPLEPLQLLDVALQSPLKGPGWVCQQGERRVLVRCENHDNGVSVQWTEKENGRKLILITSQQFEMRWLLETPEVIPSLKSNLFDLSVPPDFKNIHIN